MRQRDKAILESLRQFRCLSRDDICDLHFSGLKYPVPTCNNVLKRLRLQGYIDANTEKQPYVYMCDPSPIKKNSQKINHFLDIVRFYRDIKRVDIPRVFNVEPKYGNKGTVEPDAFMIWQNAPFFVEIQRSHYSKKQFEDKLARYDAYHASGEWAYESWQPKEKIFPYLWIIGEQRFNINKSYKVFQSRNVKEFLLTVKG
ncbi:replication-relaxation family protein [Alkalihalophilus marmarensis]|uniref:replication-relaxation family protein n=1 Tax=Alkalihalophilus marmarensis TaxID=521377 RepID=UPI00203A3D02|nr:replication-relaxation family protein [Alkalihalophilus marmarensis]MCM3488753.1 replication-relaxation family protein [Alkalihalophilus marmarensis]